ncbi:sugar transferase [Flavobacterium ranwuense]|uniref:Sugar transferase n=1 Tax=Flavobacterium ranwuense TaxID=2541725 RepID=A0ABY2DQW7_9FLAO|nr:sugar transferase [Flavobacterium ranwuense]TDE29156.1 sugar transferase [Flavobacterium ranwuense]
MYKNYFKRVIDFVVAFVSLILLSPLFIIVMLGLFLANQGKPFFVQLRPGKNEAIFKIIKFKTMNDKKDEKGELLPDAKRLTTIGSFVRKTSLDEIPQLINVLKGDMSLIGPRPLLMKYLPYYSENERRRHTVRPGITGLAQINGRNTVKWDERLAYDVDYVENLSFKLDLEIIYKTVLKVIASENIVVDPESIMQNLDDERSSQH